MARVSVIIPSFNRSAMLCQAVESVLEQSFQDFELLVVDDGSTDNSLEILIKKFKSAKIKIIEQQNLGVSAARNTGIKAAAGQYFAFLDSDDLWLKDKLKIQLAALASNKEYLVCHGNEKWLRNGKHLNQKKIHRKIGGYQFAHNLPFCRISPSAVIIERSVFNDIGLFDESLLVCEDYELWLRITAKYPLLFIEQPLIVKQGGHAGQLSRQNIAKERFRIVALEKLLEKQGLDSEKKKLVYLELKKKCKTMISIANNYDEQQLAEFYRNKFNYYENCPNSHP